jgi:4'-phosphopantetheinyl transferase EntD
VLDGLFPDGVVTAWGDPLEPSAGLLPEEEALVARAVPKRKLEFAKGRECARRALASFGLRDVLLLSGKDREPLWPAEVTGSITHTAGLCAVAVAASNRYVGLGIDAEPAESLERGVAERVCRGDDDRSWRRIASLESSVLPRLVFSVKEAVYKCLFPITRTFLGFDQVSVELDEGAFRATLRIAAPPFRPGTVFAGRWRRVPGVRDTASHLIAGAWIVAETSSRVQ